MRQSLAKIRPYTMHGMKTLELSTIVLMMSGALMAATEKFIQLIRFTETGRYYVKETKAPKGFQLDERVHTLTVKAGETTTFYRKRQACEIKRI